MKGCIPAFPNRAGVHAPCRFSAVPLSLSVPQFPCLQNGENRIKFMRSLRGSHGLILPMHKAWHPITQRWSLVAVTILKSMFIEQTQ